MPFHSPLEIQHRMMRYKRTRDLKDLHETASISGNIITIPRVPYPLYVVLRNVFQKCRLDYSYRVRKAKRRRSWEGTLHYRMPLPTHDRFKEFAAILLSQMWDGGSSKSFYPPAARKNARLMRDWGSADVTLHFFEQYHAVYQPDAGITFTGADYPFLILEVAFSETTKHVIKKAKNYLRGSKGRIVYVMVLSFSWVVNDSHLAEYSPPADDDSPTSSLTELSDTAASPPNPDMIDREFGIYGHARVGTENGHMDEPEKVKKIQTLNMKVWVFKKTLTARPTFDNPNAEVITPVTVIDGVEVYPTQPQVDTGFFIEWNEISNQPIPGHHNFYVSINQLHQLAYEADTENESHYALKSNDNVDTYLSQSSADKELSQQSLSDSDSDDPNVENYKPS